MASLNTVTYPSDPADPRVRTLGELAVDYALSHGLVMKPAADGAQLSNAAGLAVHAPLALFPSPFPRAGFERALTIQPHLNRLFDRIAADDEFLETYLSSLIKADEFTRRLYDLYRVDRETPRNQRQTAVMGFHRSDYLLHAPDGQLSTAQTIQQVEFNTVSVSFASLGQVTTDFHRYLWKHPDYRQLLVASNPALDTNPDHHLPRNNSLHGLGDLLAKAWSVYGKPNAIVLMVVQPNERNIYDQRFVEYELQTKHNINLVRLTVAEVTQKVKLDSANHAMVNGQEVAVIYYRWGYSPDDYNCEEDWTARGLLERSWAIKCPNIAYQLAGTKKVQEVLSRPGALERFIDEPAVCQQLRDCFTGLYPMDSSPAGRQAVAQALESPENFVMKPQREGGGNNIYGTDIPGVLRHMNESEQEAHILMDLIRPPKVHNLLIRNGELHHGPVISELGIFGAWLSDEDGTVHINETRGHLLRTKVESSNEGGIAAGFGVIDSPLLI